MFPRITCPSCHHQFDIPSDSNIHELPPANQPTWLPQQDELTFLHGEGHRLDHLIHHLQHEKARLLRRVNTIQTPTKILSFDILSTIFQYACPPIDFGTRKLLTEYPNEPAGRRYHHPEDDFQLVLGAVSSHWRQVAWSTPRLWTTLSMQILETVSASNEALLNLHFQNARTLPMSIELDLRAQLLLLSKACDSKSRAESISALKSVRASIFTNNAGKISNLILTGCPPEWAPYIGGKLSRCEAMTLSWPKQGTGNWDMDRDRFSLVGLPFLRHVRLRELSSPPILPCSTITILELTRVPTMTCVELLTRCPNLIQFKCRNPYTSPSETPLVEEPVVLKHLELFQWYNNFDTWCIAPLRRVRFTCLRVLKWSGWHISPLSDGFDEQRDHFCRFFSSLPDTLQTLQLKQCAYSFDDLKDIFGDIRHVSKVRLKQCPGYVNEMVLEMIGHPAAGLDWDYSQNHLIAGSSTPNGPRMLASIDVLVLDDGPCVEHVARMLETLERVRTVTRSFRLELQRKVRWEPAVLDRIRGVLARGFKFEVIERSELVDFESMTSGLWY